MAATAEATKRLRLDAIRTDGTQTRDKLNHVVASEYAAAMSAGAEFPPIHVWHDGKAYWLSRGHHRLEAHKLNEAKTIECIVHQGSQSDAQFHGLGDNVAHGLRRTNEDKWREVEICLKHQKCEGWSDRRIAEYLGLSQPFVGKVRSEVKTVITSKPALGNLGKSCPNCGGASFTDDGDCAKCYDPCGDPPNEIAEKLPREKLETRFGRDGKQYPVAMRETIAVPKQKAFSASEHAIALFDYLRDLAAKWPMEHRESLAKVLIQMSREVLTITEAGK